MTRREHPDQVEGNDRAAAHAAPDGEANRDVDGADGVHVAGPAAEHTGAAVAGAAAADGAPEKDGPPEWTAPPPLQDATREHPGPGGTPTAAAPQELRWQDAPQEGRHSQGAPNGSPATRPASGPAHSYSPRSVPASHAASRYGRPVVQPSNAQTSQGANPNFSQPTVRIGGRVQSEQPSPQSPAGGRTPSTRVPRRASLQLRYLEPWSVLKVSLVLAVAGFFAWMVAVGVLYSMLAGMGVWDQLNGTYSDLTSVNDAQAGDDLISAGGVFGVAALIGLVNIVLITAMCTVGAFIYNASTDLAGGVEITLSERD